MASKSPDGVGYKRPPLATRFKPGQSGNPKGRPKGSQNFATVLQAELNAPITVTENGRRKKITKREGVAKELVNKAVAGDPKMVPALLGEMRFQEGLLPAVPAQEVFNTTHDVEVMESIIRRLRESDPSAARPEPASDRTTEPSPPAKPNPEASR